LDDVNLCPTTKNKNKNVTLYKKLGWVLIYVYSIWLYELLSKYLDMVNIYNELMSITLLICETPSCKHGILSFICSVTFFHLSSLIPKDKTRNKVIYKYYLGIFSLCMILEVQNAVTSSEFHYTLGIAPLAIIIQLGNAHGILYCTIIRSIINYTINNCHIYDIILSLQT